VTEQSAGPVAALDQRTRRSGEVAYVVGEGGCGELAGALTQSGEVEPEHGVARLGQARGQAGHGVQVFGAREAVRQQDAATRLVVRHVEPANQACAGTTWELDVAHGHAPTSTLATKATGPQIDRASRLGSAMSRPSQMAHVMTCSCLVPDAAPDGGGVGSRRGNR
jgi:hypothetical protein